MAHSDETTARRQNGLRLRRRPQLRERWTARAAVEQVVTRGVLSPIWVRRTPGAAPHSSLLLKRSRSSWPSSSTGDMRGVKGCRRIRRLCTGALLWVTVAACASIGNGPSTVTYVPQGGVHAYNSTIALNDVWLDVPEGVPRGGAADLRLYAVNEFGRRDALTGVTSPLAQGDEIRLGARTVERIPLPPGEAVNLEWGDGAGVRLTGFRRPLCRASWVPISIHFEHSKPVTMQVVAGPLGLLEPPDATSARSSTTPPPRRPADSPDRSPCAVTASAAK